MKKLCVVILIAMTTACSSNFTKTGESSFNSLPVNCQFAVYTTKPSKSFDEIGVVEFVAHPMVGFPHSISRAKEEAQPFVCRAGGNGLLLWESNGHGRYLQATVIRFKE